MLSSKKRIFIIAGMPRCGTTFFYYKLQEHPSVFVPFRKETNYFSTTYERGVDWYLNLYKDMNANEKGADISPFYFINDSAIKRIKKFNPNIKIILGVRLPSDFSLSTYNQLLSHTYNVPPFKEYLQGHTWYVGSKEINLSFKDTYITRRIDEYKKTFGKNILFFDFRLFQSDPLKILRAIESFLNLPPYFNENNFENIVINAGKRKNLKILSYLLGREFVISALGVLFPRKLVVAIRKMFDKASKSKNKQVPMVYDPVDTKLAKSFFAEEDELITKMFSDNGIMLGTGEAFKLTGLNR